MQTIHTGIPIANEAEELRYVPDDICYRILMAADGSQALNSYSSTLSHLHSLSSTNANAFPLTKARHSIAFPTLILTVCSPTPRSLFYSAQSNLPITRRLFRPVKPSGNLFPYILIFQTHSASSQLFIPFRPPLTSCANTGLTTLQGLVLFGLLQIPPCLTTLPNPESTTPMPSLQKTTLLPPRQAPIDVCPNVNRTTYSC